MSCKVTTEVIAVLDRLPDPIVVVAGSRLAYANPRALVVLGPDARAMMGGDSANHGVAAGAAILTDQDSDGCLTLRIMPDRGGRTVAVRAWPVPVLLHRDPGMLLVLGEYGPAGAQHENGGYPGELTAALTHEVANLSSSLLCNLELVVRDCDAALARTKCSEPGSPEASGQIRQLLSAITEGARDALDAATMLGNMVRAVKGILRGRLPAPADDVAGLRECIEKALTMMRFELPGRDCVTIDVDASFRVRVNQQALTHLFLNLLLNAAQATPSDNRERHRILVDASAESGAVVVRVQDTGTGIPEAVLPRIFDPFFTTKPDGIGTGLGLYFCQVVVTRYGGALAVSSHEGCGTVFRVTLPVSAPRQLNNED